MTTATATALEVPRRLRAWVRAREAGTVALAAVVGAIAGGIVTIMSGMVTVLHRVFFGLGPGERLSASESLNPYLAVIVPALGGLVLGLAALWISHMRRERFIDPIEANAVRGGRMSFRGSMIVALQTVWSSGVGASVGLEAGYTQAASGIASWFGRLFHLRRTDLRLMVGCGAAGAISGAFGAPFGGAFYAFELVMGGYTASALVPIAIAALNGYLVAKAFAPMQLGLYADAMGPVTGKDLVIASAFGVIAALVGVSIMRGVALCEQVLDRSKLWPPLRPLIGGILVGIMAMATPQVMSSGHGALHLSGMMDKPLRFIAMVFILKIFASIVSLGSGFRGGLFFASLLLGAIGGRLFAAASSSLWPGLMLDANVYEIIGVGALSASIIGAPLTMTFIALESTGDFWLATAVLIAVLISTQITREIFGYSFATWRFHLRGETIRSAADVGWIRDLTVGRMMRPDFHTVQRDTTIEAFRTQFPLGSTGQVIAVDPDGHYAGIVVVPEAHSVETGLEKPVEIILHHKDTVLLPSMNVREAAAAFDRAEAESLAVVDSPVSRQAIGLLSESHTLRRYAEESEQRRRELVGET
ncbi:MAG TPA: chloride channel protein [Xanthobacteraceae bacterium]|nr:chloride channel protein [Xanthobacteraceae bacterium]